MPAMQPYSRMAKDSSGVGRRDSEKAADTFKMVYTPFHGTGYKLIPEALKRLGMKHVICGASLSRTKEPSM